MIFVAQYGVGAVTATVVAHEELGLEAQRRAVRLHLIALALDWRKHRYWGSSASLTGLPLPRA